MIAEPHDDVEGEVEGGVAPPAATRCGFVVLLGAREGIDEEAEAIFAKVATVNHPKLLVINKVDIVDKEKLLKLAQAANERLKFSETFMVSAMTGDGVDDLRH